MIAPTEQRPGDSEAAPITLAGGALGFNWLPVFVADRRGIFARHGVKVSLKRLGSVDKATAAVWTGEAHLAITPPEGAIADSVAGGRLRIIAGNVNRLPLSLVAHPRITAIEELKGCRLGTSSMKEGTAIYTREMLSRHGLKYPGDYEFAVVGVHPARWEALKQGTIDAAVQLVPYNFIAFDEGWSNLGEVSDYVPEIVFTALIGDAGWIADNRGSVRALLAGLIEATALLYDGTQDEIIPILAEITGSDAHYATRSLDYMREKAVFARNLEIPENAFAKTIELMVKADLLEDAARDRARLALDRSLLAELAGH